jgi:polyhydroxyalkanoate synthesis regulator phasin
MSQEGPSIQAQIEDLQQRLEDARARIPKHTPPPALMAEIDEMEENLAHLQAMHEANADASRIADLEARLQEARARIPKHTPPPALMAEIDELEEELARLRPD